MLVNEKELNSQEQVEEYLNSFGIYIWHQSDDREFIRYILNLGQYVYVYSKNHHRYFLIYKSENEWGNLDFNMIKNVLVRYNKTMKFILKGFAKYVMTVGVYNV